MEDSGAGGLPSGPSGPPDALKLAFVFIRIREIPAAKLSGKTPSRH